MSRQSEARGLSSISGWPEITNLVENIEYLLLVKFVVFYSAVSRREVENVSANQRPIRPSLFSNRPEN